MNNLDALTGIYNPFSLPGGIVIPDEVQYFIRDRMQAQVEAAERRIRQAIGYEGREAGQGTRLTAQQGRSRLAPTVLALHNEGISLTVIGKVMKISHNTVKRIITEAGE